MKFALLLLFLIFRMKRIKVAMTALVLSTGCYAQDMIVKKDGSIIQAKVSEIGTSEVKYKKWSNQDGPSYAIVKSDILAITYQNGEKETFEINTARQSNNTESPTSLNEMLSRNNSNVINTINNAPFSINDEKFVKKKTKTNRAGIQYAVSEKSIIDSDVLSVSFTFGRVGNGGSIAKTKKGKSELDFLSYEPVTKGGLRFQVMGYPAVVIKLTNKTDNIMYIDLANTFLSKGESAESYYVPTATTTSTTSTSGGSFNLGGITNGLGIGGVAGSLANATTIGGSNGKTISNTVFSQRVISIPPHSSVSLPHKNIENGKFLNTHGDGATTVKTANIMMDKTVYVGEEIEFNEENSPYRLTFITKLSYDEGMISPITSTTNLYCKKILGLERVNWGVGLKSLHYSENGLYTYGRIGE